MTRTGVSFFGITNWIFYSGFTKAFKPQQTGIAFAAGETFWSRIVTTVRERKIDTQLDGFENYLSFGKFDKRCVNLEASAFHARLCSKIRQSLKRFNEFRTAIGVPAVVNRVYAEKNVISLNDFRPSKCVGQKDRVARGHVRDG